MKNVLILSLLIYCFFSFRFVSFALWPQFRGVNASGVAQGNYKLPDQIGPNENLLWKAPLPPGHSSPVVFGNQVFLTAVEDGSLYTVGLSKETGKVLWKVKAEHKTLEEVHRHGNHAQSSPATDGERVISFFGSSGLFCYSLEGKLLWHLPMGPFKNGFGAASSPIISGNWVILNQDHDKDSFLIAVDKRTGTIKWKTDRPEFPRGFATPITLNVDGKKQIVVSGTLKIIGYDFETGQKIWTVGGISRIVSTTPVVGDGGVIFSATSSPGADPGKREVLETFSQVKKKFDKNNDGMIEAKELPEGSLKGRFNQFDLNKDDHLSGVEYVGMKDIFERVENVALAINTGGRGNVTGSHVLWKQPRYLPYIPSPIFYKGILFWVKRGGIAASIDPKTGEIFKVGRIFGQSSYYSSPVAGDGKIYFISQKGELSVISAKKQWEELSKADFTEEVWSTPAISEGRIYLRSSDHLYCFGLATSIAEVQE